MSRIVATLLACALAACSGTRRVRAQARQPRREIVELARATRQALVDTDLGVPPERARSWVVEIDPSIPSPFEVHGPEGLPREGATICRTAGLRTVCSEAAIEALASLQNNRAPVACGGEFREGEQATITEPVTAFYFVLAHELGHVAHGHASALGHPALTLQGDRDTRLRHLRLSAHGSPVSLRQEREADELAARALHAMVGRNVARNDPRHAGWIATMFFTRVRLMLQCVDQSSPFGLEHANAEDPSSPSYVRQQAREIACLTTRLPEGASMPHIRGTHGDWATRLASIARYRSEFPDLDWSLVPTPEQAAYFREFERQFARWAAHAPVFYDRLATEVGNATLSFEPTWCSPRQR